MVAAQGGPADFLENWKHHLPIAPVQIDVFPNTGGNVTSIDTRAVGLAVVDLGGGRRRDGDAIDPGVGMTALATIGDSVGPDNPLGQIHAADEASAMAAAAALRAACRIGESRHRGTLVHERIA